MAFTPWEFHGPSFNNCNCEWGCPCQFNSLPSHGDCLAITAMNVEKGHFGDTPLDGLTWVATFTWPGAVHQGNGTCQAIIDERADEAQRDALVKILHGKEQAAGNSIFQIFSTTMTTVHDPLFLPIEFTCNIINRVAELRVPGVLETIGEPIRNATTGAAQSVQVDLPNGFEWTKAEFASGTTKATGDVKLDFNKSHGHFSEYHFNQDGIIR